MPEFLLVLAGYLVIGCGFTYWAFSNITPAPLWMVPVLILLWPLAVLELLWIHAIGGR